MITAFVKQRIIAGVTARTANVDAIVLRSVLKAAVDEGLIATLGHQDGGMLLCKVYSHLLDRHKRDMATRLVFSPTVVQFPNQAPGPAAPSASAAH